MVAVTHDRARGPARSGVRVENKTAPCSSRRPKVRVVKGIVGAAITVRAGHVGKYAAIRQPHDGALLAHALVKPHGPTQRFRRIGQVPRNDVRIDRGRDAVEIHGGNLAYTEFLLVSDGRHHDVRNRDGDSQDQSAGYDRYPRGQGPRSSPKRHACSLLPEQFFPVSVSLRGASARPPKNPRFGAGSAVRLSSAPGSKTNSVSWTIAHLECGTYCRVIEIFGAPGT